MRWIIVKSVLHFLLPGEEGREARAGAKGGKEEGTYIRTEVFNGKRVLYTDRLLSDHFGTKLKRAKKNIKMK